MFPELNSLLGGGTVQQGKVTLVAARRTDGNFLLHHFLSSYLRAGCNVCFLGLVQSFSHYNIIAQKLGVNLVLARGEGRLVFLEGLRSCTDLLFGKKEDGDTNPLRFLRCRDGSDLRPLYDFVCASLAPPSGGSWRCPVLIVDDVGVLLSLGATAAQVLDFMQYCRAHVCCKHKGNVLCLIRGDSEDEENELVMKSLWHQSNLVLQAEGLPTGFCKDVHGQLTITWRAAAAGERDRAELYQYKIQDKSVSFFARGLSAAVL
uniref:Elongator complex protein 6 n=1 Tax=Leptobrachium leishanense TaxID=445787 RepID=A0A8C5N235_9ANUR